MGRHKGSNKVSKAANTIKFFQGHIVDGKTITQCSKDIGVTRKTLHGYKRSPDFRQMAITHLEDSDLGGLKGIMSGLVKALDAKRPIVTDNKDGSTKITMKPDMKVRMTAIQEVGKIYGLHAPIRKDVKIGISVSSDEELFGSIEEAERKCRTVQSYVKGEDGFELSPDSQGSDSGDSGTSERTLLQRAALPEPE